jgi:AraC-like DNA-binding protein
VAAVGRANLVLNPKGGEALEVGGRPAAPELAPWVSRHWSTRWDRRGQPPRITELLTDVSVHMVFERGVTRIVGPTTRKFTRRLDDVGRVVGVRFAPGGLTGFTRVPILDLVDRIVALGPVLGIDIASIEDEVLGHDDDEASFAAVERFLGARTPATLDPGLLAVQRIVACIDDEPQLLRVDDLCARVGLPPREVQRLCRHYLAFGPKHVLRRVRLREAAERIKNGESENFAGLAVALGYFDHAHFAHDFKAVTGRSPSQWSRELKGR